MLTESELTIIKNKNINTLPFLPLNKITEYVHKYRQQMKEKKQNYLMKQLLKL